MAVKRVSAACCARALRVATSSGAGVTAAAPSRRVNASSTTPGLLGTRAVAPTPDTIADGVGVAGRAPGDEGLGPR
jgi:hypothetical protein